MSRALSVPKGMLTSNLPLKIVAFTLTLSLFIWVRDDRQASVVAYAPVRIVIPEGMVLTGTPVDRVRLTVRGKYSDIERFDPTTVSPIQLTANPTQESQLLPITAEMVRLPSGLRAAATQPDVVRITLETEQRKKVDITPRLVGEPPEGFQIGEPIVTPQKIEFRGPQSNIMGLNAVLTQPIDVSGKTTSFEEEVTLVTDDPLVSYDLQTPIRVRVPIKTLEVPRLIQGIPLAVLNASLPYELRPETISATVRGPKSVVDALTAEQMQVTIDLAGETKPGSITRQPKIMNLPPNVSLSDYHPKDILITLRRAEAPE